MMKTTSRLVSAESATISVIRLLDVKLFSKSGRL
jgi:hypothetical protein